jgi:transcriptional regulator with XRE-family HTH domain
MLNWSMTAAPDATSVLAGVAGRLRRLRTERGLTLVELSERTGISKSTLSRLETGQRKPSLELLLPIAHAYSVALNELVGAPEVGDPRIRPQTHQRGTRTVVPLTQQPSGMHAWKLLIPPEHKRPQLKSHDGYEWLYVLSGELRLLLGGHDITMTAGEVAEFDTGVPHWFGAAGSQPVEILSILSRPGERARVRAAPRRKGAR